MTAFISVGADHAGWAKTLPEAEALAERAALRVLRAEGWGRKSVTLDITLSSDAKVQKLNHEWREKDKPTNVLSFPLESPDIKVPRGRPRQLGDIILARQTLIREAKEQGKPLAHHFVHLVVHGTLHLLGYDHIKAKEAKVMENLEIKILAGLGIPDPYEIEENRL